jgi:hypothetical protein
LGHLKKRAIAQEREAARIALVALACEVVVLTSLMDQGLESVTAHLGAEEIRLSGWIHRNAAFGLVVAGHGLGRHSARDRVGLSRFDAHSLA